MLIKRTVPRSTNARRTRQETLPARLLKSTNARRTRGKLLSALSAIAAPSAGTLQNLCTFLGRVPALGAAMAESALSNFPRVHRTFVDFNKRAANAGSAFCRVRHAFVDLGSVLLRVELFYNFINIFVTDPKRTPLRIFSRSDGVLSLDN